MHVKPVLLDADVTLRPWRLEDAHALVECLDGEESIARFLDRIPQPYTLDDATAYLRRCDEGWRTGSASNFAVLVDGFEGAVGSLGVHWTEIEEGIAEIGYWLAERVRGRGVTTRGTRMASRWAFEVEPRLERLQIRAATDNPASNAVAERSGFVREGVLRSAHLDIRTGRRVDWVMWSLLRNEL